MMNRGASALSNEMAVVWLKEENPNLEDFVRWIMDMVTFMLPPSHAKDLPPVLPAMLELSPVFDKAAELLCNDSLDNIMSWKMVYLFVLNLVEKIGAHRALIRLVQDDRFSKSRSSGLENISFAMDSSGAGKSTQKWPSRANLSLVHGTASQILRVCVSRSALSISQ